MSSTNLPFEMPAFGGPADDYAPEAFDPDDIWIKGFQVGTTQIRICPAEDVNAKGEPIYGARAWPTEREHYDQVVKAFPCSEKYHIPCPGCQSTLPSVRERNRRYYFNALDKDGEQRIFKIGQGLFDIFSGRQQRFYDEDPDNKQPLSDRDYHIIRIGSTKTDTKYDPDAGKEYEVEWPEEFYDIKAILQRQFEKAWVHFNSETVVAPAPSLHGEQAESNGDGRIKAAKKTTAPVMAAAKTAPTVVADEDEDVLGRNPTIDELEDATSGALKAYLRRPEVNIEFPARAARSRLLDLAKDSLNPKF